VHLVALPRTDRQTPFDSPGSARTGQATARLDHSPSPFPRPRGSPASHVAADVKRQTDTSGLESRPPFRKVSLPFPPTSRSSTKPSRRPIAPALGGLILITRSFLPRTLLGPHRVARSGCYECEPEGKGVDPTLTSNRVGVEVPMITDHRALGHYESASLPDVRTM
jgi:hypothetical protein